MKQSLRILPLVILFIMAAFNSNAQLTPDQLVKKISWDVRMEPAENISVGDKVTVIFDATIAEGFHIYSVTPTDMGPLPTEILSDKLSGAEASGASQEKNGKLHTEFDELFGTNVYYYDNQVTFFQEYTIRKTTVSLDGFIDFQVCSDDMCVPHSVPFSFSFQTAKR